MSDRPPTTLEVAIRSFRGGQIPVEALIWALASSTLFVSSGADVSDDLSTFRPLLFARDDGEMLAVFTDPDQVGDFSTTAPYLVTMTGMDVVRRLPPRTGIVVNPGSEFGFELPPAGSAQFAADLAAGLAAWSTAPE